MRKLLLYIILGIFICNNAFAQTAKDYYMQAKTALEDGDADKCILQLGLCENAMKGPNIKIEAMKAQAYASIGDYVKAQIAYNNYMNFARQVGFTDHPADMVTLGDDIAKGLIQEDKDFKKKFEDEQKDNLVKVQDEVKRDDEELDKKYKDLQESNTKAMYDKAMDTRDPALLGLFKEVAPTSTLTGKVNNELDKQQNPEKYIEAAVKSKDVTETAFLISKGASVNFKNYSGNSLLHIAVANIDNAMLKKLVELGANLEIKNRDNDTPLLAAIKDSKSSTANYLVTLGSNVKADNFGVTALQYAVFHNVTATVSVLLDNGCDANARFKISAIDYTPLYYAVYIHQSTSIATDLIKHGAKVNDFGMQKWTPLMGAVYNKNLEMVKLLLAQKADANVKGPNEWTALHFAAREGLADIATELLKHGASKRNKDKWNRTPKRVALENDQKTALKAIKQY